MGPSLITEPLAIQLALKPRWALAYLQGEKRIELRKSIPRPEKRYGLNLDEIPFVFIVSGLSIAFLMGTGATYDTDKPINLLSRLNLEHTGLTTEEYRNYFSNSKLAYAIYFKQFNLVYPPMRISAPQAFRYSSAPSTSNLYSMENSKVRESLITMITS